MTEKPLSKAVNQQPKSRFIDLSHTIEDGLVTYKGLPAPIVCDYLSREDSRGHYAPGTEFQIARIEMVANTGTYIDSPFHRYADGKDLSQVEAQQFAGLQGIVIRADYRQNLEINASFFKDKPLRGRAVLVHTGWDAHWNSEAYFENNPYLNEEAASFLKEQGAALVGIDSLNIDNIQDGSRPAHSILLGANILVVEHLCSLGALPDQGFFFYAIPPKFKGVGTFPVRALAEIKEET